jgi:hypothetical protein
MEVTSSYDPQGFHDWMDAAMVAQHARVHQALMEGAANVFAASFGTS